MSNGPLWTRFEVYVADWPQLGNRKLNDTVISVENISKLYRLGEVGTGTLSHDLNRWWHKVRGKEDPYLKIGLTNDRTRKGDSDYVWALKDIHFKVKRGEVLGIVGRNGAGKSTLLKILSRVTSPTTGEIKVKGRIASLLEVGTGFHPELTGRENIYLNGAILGMRRHEITRKFDEIVAFAEVERYIDTPVKRYSSGMYVRLAFAVAAHLEPEILIVDEVLAVGDAQFQEKCLGKMRDVAGHDRTILFVSHNMSAIHQLCSRCVLLENGGMADDGTPSEIIRAYLSASGSNELCSAKGPLRHASVKQIEDGIFIEAEYYFPTEVGLPSLGVVIKNHLGFPVFGANPQTAGINSLNSRTKKGKITVLIRQPKLRSGRYVASLWLGDGVRDHVAIPDAVTLDVVNTEDRKSHFSHENVGSVYPECIWSFKPSE